MNYAVIMAGGMGKRLWPLSREKHPKQILKIFNGKTLLQLCIERLLPLFDKEKIIILTNAKYQDIVRKNTPQIPARNVVAEPLVRDTAPAVGLAAAILQKKDKDATFAVLTADQVIEPQDIFRTTLTNALKFVNGNPDCLLTFGIHPTSPSTQYGYIEYAEKVKNDNDSSDIYKLHAFKEKPDQKTAEKYIDSGHFLWNSGMFVWKANTILDNLYKFLPESKQPLQKISAASSPDELHKTIEQWFPKMPKISIDYAVMEKTQNARVIRLECYWKDMGSFSALAEVTPSDKNKNTLIAKTNQLLDSKNNIIVTEQSGHLIAAVGLESFLVAHSPDATLICPRDQAHRLKELLDIIKKQKGDKFL